MNAKFSSFSSHIKKISLEIKLEVESHRAPSVQLYNTESVNTELLRFSNYRIKQQPWKIVLLPKLFSAVLIPIIQSL
jgi:hypothetical protein